MIFQAVSNLPRLTAREITYKSFENITLDIYAKYRYKSCITIIIHFLSLCPLRLAIMLNFNISKVACFVWLTIEQGLAS